MLATGWPVATTTGGASSPAWTWQPNSPRLAPQCSERRLGMKGQISGGRRPRGTGSPSYARLCRLADADVRQAGSSCSTSILQQRISEASSRDRYFSVEPVQ
jgi:hypothetical protein